MCHRLKQLRKEKGLTQDQLSELLHISQSAISKWENDPQKMSIEQSAELASFFEVTLEYFLGLSNEKENKNSPSTPGEKEITQIYQNLSDENRAKLLELARLYQGAQQNSAENQ